MDRSSGYLWIRNSLVVIAVSFLVVFLVLSVREGIWKMEPHAAAQEACREFVGAPFPMFSDCLEEQSRLHDRPAFAPGLPWLIAGLSAAVAGAVVELVRPRDVARA